MAKTKSLIISSDDSQETAMEDNETLIEFDPAEFLPLNPIAYVILAALYQNTLSGYEILEQVNNKLQRTTVTATFYRHLGRLVDDELVQIIIPPKSKLKDKRQRNFYQITSNGEIVLLLESKIRQAILKELAAEHPIGSNEAKEKSLGLTLGLSSSS